MEGVIMATQEVFIWYAVLGGFAIAFWVILGIGKLLQLFIDVQDLKGKHNRK